MPRRKEKASTGLPTLVTSAELAEIVGVDFDTINNWIRRGVNQPCAYWGTAT
jgi:hypothetical protein